jgi:hypothetical protein
LLWGLDIISANQKCFAPGFAKLRRAQPSC